MSIELIAEHFNNAGAAMRHLEIEIANIEGDPDGCKDANTAILRLADVMSVLEGLFKISRALIEEVTELRARDGARKAGGWTPADAIEAINKLELHNGDVLVVRIGDRNCGWIPGVDQEQRTIELFSDALAHEGLADKVTLLVCHYGHELEVIRDAASVRRHSPKDPELAATSKALGWEDD